MLCREPALPSGPGSKLGFAYTNVKARQGVSRRAAFAIKTSTINTDQTNRELKAVHDAIAEESDSAEYLLDRTHASLEHLGEVAEAMMPASTRYWVLRVAEPNEHPRARPNARADLV